VRERAERPAPGAVRDPIVARIRGLMKMDGIIGAFSRDHTSTSCAVRRSALKVV